MSDDQSPAKSGGPEQGWNKPAVPEDDTEGQAMHWSNKDLKKDVKPIKQAPSDDTEGQLMHWSNKDLKKDVKPIKGKTS
jgi:hypothetical protein